MPHPNGWAEWWLGSTVLDEGRVPIEPINEIDRSLCQRIDQLEQRIVYLENLLRFYEHDGK